MLYFDVVIIFCFCNFIVGTFCADTLIIELLFLYDVAIDIHFVHELWCFFIHEVDDLATSLAEKVHMTCWVSIVTYSVVVYGNHLGCSFFAQHTQGVVHCRPAEGRNLFVEPLIYIFHCRVDGVSDEPVHDG